MNDVLQNNPKESMSRRLFQEPSTLAVRPLLIRYIEALVDDAMKMSKSQLLGDAGHELAMDLCGVIAFQCADGVQHDNWLNEQSEPLLYRLLDITGRLDADSRDESAWREVFAISSRLRK